METRILCWAVQGPSGYHLIINIDTLTYNFSFLYQKWCVKMTINTTKCSLNKCSFLISLQVFFRWHGNIRKGYSGFACCPLQYTLIPQTGSSLRVWLEAKSMHRLVISVWHGKRAHLFHMPLVLNFRVPYWMPKVWTCGGPHHCPRYTGELPAHLTGPG